LDISALSEQERTTLLQIARGAIAAELVPGSIAESPGALSQSLQAKRGCFVTLNKQGMLRGCIGTIAPVSPLVDAVAENARGAAFHDPRFPPLSIDELQETDIEISVLTVPRRLDFRDAEDLLAKLQPGVHGVVLSRGLLGATFLPQVWEQLPEKEMFLGFLCQKAGLQKDCWKAGDIEIKVYAVEHFSDLK
jgi:AmmeMemoRadiSam system protein A